MKYACGVRLDAFSLSPVRAAVQHHLPSSSSRGKSHGFSLQEVNHATQSRTLLLEYVRFLRELCKQMQEARALGNGCEDDIV